MAVKSKEWTISYKQLGVIIASFVLGLIVALFISNSQAEAQSNFTTTELIGFVLSVILSGASIVLAISAIALGKLSEQSVIERSDESIRLQNEVFVKTTEALQRIESSTGVTEKRIEDIISGRVGDISHQVAEIASKHSRQSPKATKELEEAIRKSLMKEIRKESNEESQSRQINEIDAGELRENEYQKSHNLVLLGLSNVDKVKTSKIGHGVIGSDDGNVFDGLFEKEGLNFAVSTFRTDISSSQLKSFIPVVVEEGVKREISKIFFVLFKDESSEEGIEDKLSSSLVLMKDEIIDKVKFVECSVDNHEKAIESISEQL